MKTGTDLPMAPPVHSGGGEGGSDWIELIRARDDFDAHLVSGLLSEAGIESRHLRDGRAPVWLGAAALEGSLRVMVRRIDFEAARLVLAETAFEGPAFEREAVRPPRGARGARWVLAALLGSVVVVLIVLQAVGATIACQLPALCDVLP